MRKILFHVTYLYAKSIKDYRFIRFFIKKSALHNISYQYFTISPHKRILIFLFSVNYIRSMCLMNFYLCGDW